MTTPLSPAPTTALHDGRQGTNTALFEALLNQPKPSCCSHGACCKGASPSVPYHQLWAKAAAGDAFARGFLSIMEAYPSHEAARAVVGTLVDKTLAAAEKQETFAGPEDVVFYHCRYLNADNRCGVYEDRPQFCRDYPDTPFVIMADGCAFAPWAAACKQQFALLEDEHSTLKALQNNPQGASQQAAIERLVTAYHQQKCLEAALGQSRLGTFSPRVSWLGRPF